MIHLILDTNIYRSNIMRNNAAFKTLESMLRKSFIKLHIPFFIENEFLTFFIEESESKISQSIKTLKWLTQISYINENKKIELVSNLLNKEKIISHLQSSFKNWSAKNECINYELEHNSCKRAIKSYFQGSPPFTKIKDRENIPDSFIFEEISDLLNKYNQMGM